MKWHGFLIASALVSIVGCSSSSEPAQAENAMVVDGEGMSGRTFEFAGAPISKAATIGGLGTAVHLGSEPSSDDYPEVGIIPPAAESGTWTLGRVPGQARLSFEFGPSGSRRFFKEKSGTLTITTFGRVGERVTGTFSGTFADDGGKTITIRDGHFSVVIVDGGKVSSS